MIYHTPVLLNTCIEALQIKPDGIYVDATFGGGGHSKEILANLGPEGRLFGFDQDPDASRNLPEDARFTYVQQNFRFLKNYLKLYKAVPVDGILADLGVSSHQFDNPERGFSLRFDARLDMRMDPAQEKDAEWLVNNLEEEELKRLFRSYGEIRQAGRIAGKIINQRAIEPIRTTGTLATLIKPFAPRGEEHQLIARVFQALRIEVNGELEALKSLLLQSSEVLRPGGRLVIISYHSLEDRLVKNFFRNGKFEGEAEKDIYGNMDVPFRAVTRKPIRPSSKEIENNNRARSALLRIAQKL